MSGLRVRVLGSFAMAANPSGPTISLKARKAQELIGLLLLTPGQAKSRDAAAEAMFPDGEPDASRKQVRQALWHIHQAVGRGAANSPRLIVADGEHLAVNREVSPSCDAVEFSAAVDKMISAPDDASETAMLERILDLYQGPLLEGCYSEWCLIERERLEGLYLSALDTASTMAEARTDYRAGIHWATALLRLDPAHERSHRRLMRMFHAMGDRTRALRQFERCCRALDTELGVRPSRQTVALATAIRDDRDTPDPAITISLNEPPDVVQELAELRRAVDDLRRAVVDLTSSSAGRRG